nr:pilin [Pseudothauera nasutitermitis]
MAEAMTLAGGARTAVTEFRTSEGDWPAGNTEAGLSPATDITGNYVASVSVQADGTIIAAMKGTGVSTGIRGKTLVLSPISQAGAITWVCKPGGDDPVDNKFVPTSCRS